jgi:hypothetical protein
MPIGVGSAAGPDAGSASPPAAARDGISDDSAFARFSCLLKIPVFPFFFLRSALADYKFSFCVYWY